MHDQPGNIHNIPRSMEKKDTKLHLPTFIKTVLTSAVAVVFLGTAFILSYGFLRWLWEAVV